MLPKSELNVHLVFLSEPSRDNLIIISCSWSSGRPWRIRVATSSMESIIPSYPEGWLAVHHSLGSMAEAWGVMAVFAQPGYSLEVCRDGKEREIRQHF